MLDIKGIRKSPEEFEKKLKTKIQEISLKPLLELDVAIREKKTQVETLKAKRNELSEKIALMKRKGENADALMQEVTSFHDEIRALDHELTILEPRFETELASLPNLPMD